MRVKTTERFTRHGDMPHYPIGGNPFLTEQATRTGLPVEGLMDGQETVYPEYRRNLPKSAAGPPGR